MFLLMVLEILKYKFRRFLNNNNNKLEYKDRFCIIINLL